MSLKSTASNTRFISQGCLSCGTLKTKQNKTPQHKSKLSVKASFKVT